MQGQALAATDLARALGVTFLWGLNFSLIGYCLAYIDPYTLAGLRFLLCAFPLVFFLPRPDVPAGYILAYGLCFGLGTWGLVNLGVQLGSSPGVSSIVLQTSALFTTGFGILLFGERMTVGKLAGLVLSCLGLALILELEDGSAALPGVLLVLAGAFFWGVSNSLVKRAAPDSQLAFLVWSSLVAPLPLFLVAWMQFGPPDPAALPGGGELIVLLGLLLASSYLATLYAYYVWNQLISRYDLSRVAPLSLSVPVFGLLCAHLVFGEALGASKLIAGALVIGGLIVNVRGDQWLRGAR